MAERKDALVKPRLFWSDYFGPRVISRDEIAIVRIEAYQVGLAEGELRGRIQLAREIESEFPEHRDGIGPEDAIRIRLRQVH